MIETLGHYKILGIIGSGAMGTVYRARDTRLGRTVAIKLLPPDVAADPSRRQRFLADAHAAAALSHPNIAALFEIGDAGEHLFLVFEYVNGTTLTKAIGGRPMNVRHALELGIQLADALAEAHAHGVVHRDLKPDNIIVTPKDHAKILDFGFASWTAGGAAREAAAVAITSSAVLLPWDTIRYMSPEQALGEPVDNRTDIFSLGVILFEMLTGQSPFKAPTTAGVALQILQVTAPAPSSVNPEVPAELDRIAARALAKSLDTRHASAAALGAELRSVAAVLDVRTETAEATTQSRPGRRRFPVGLVASLLVLAAVAGAAWSWREQVVRQWQRWFGPAPAPIVAVMPLEFSGEPASRLYIADGLTDDLVSRLAQIPGVVVRGRSGVRRNRGRDANQVARGLGASVVLCGSLLYRPDRVEIKAALVDTRDGSELWGQHFAGAPRNVVSLELQIAEQVAGALRLPVPASPARARTASRVVDPNAYDLYLQGVAAQVRGELPQAMSLLGRAVAADAGLAEAHAALARVVYLRALDMGRFADPAVAAAVKQEADDAAAADPDLPQTHLALALAAPALDGALSHLRRAVQADASYAEGYRQIADHLLEFDTRRALSFYRKSVAVDSALAPGYAGAAVAALLVNRPDEAAREIESGRRLDPAGHDWPVLTALVELTRGRTAQALALWRRQPPADTALRPWVLYAAILQSAGRSAEARDAITTTTRRYPAHCEARAVEAAIRFDSGEVAGAKALAQKIEQEASAPDAVAPAPGCAAFAAAAVGNAEGVAGWLRRIAGREDALRWWAREIDGVTDNMWLTRGWYPFSKVAQAPAVAAARAELRVAYQQKSEELLRALAAPLNR
jgi:serine/threonine-protein kinase